MRTTIHIDDQVYKDAKALAASMDCTVSSLIEEGLRQMISRQTTGPRRDHVRLKTVSGRGLRPGVNLDDSAKLLDLLEQANG